MSAKILQFRPREEPAPEFLYPWWYYVLYGIIRAFNPWAFK